MRPKDKAARIHADTLAREWFDSLIDAATSRLVWASIASLVIACWSLSAHHLDNSACPRAPPPLHAGVISLVRHSDTWLCSFGAYHVSDVLNDTCAVRIRPDGVILVPPFLDCPQRVVDVVYMCGYVFAEYCTLVIVPDPREQLSLLAEHTTPLFLPGAEAITNSSLVQKRWRGLHPVAELGLAFVSVVLLLIGVCFVAMMCVALISCLSLAVVIAMTGVVGAFAFTMPVAPKKDRVD